MHYRHEILVARNLPVVADRDAVYPPYSPPNFTHASSWARRARFAITVYWATGAPTAWSLGFKLQSCTLHDGARFRYQNRRWYDLDIGGQVPDLSTFADNTTDLTNPLLKVFNLDLEAIPDMGADVRLDRTVVLEGGTDPTLSIGITRELWS